MNVFILLILSGGMIMAGEVSSIESLWNFGNTKESRENFLKAMKEDASSADYKLELQTQVARTLGLERKFEEAHKLLDEIKSELKPEESLAHVRYYLERGRLFNSSGIKDKARPEFLKSYEISKKLKAEFLLVDAAHMMAIVEPSFDEQKKWTEIAIEVAENSKDQKVQDWQGSLLNNWGWSLFGNKQYSEALSTFNKALVFRKTKNNKEAIIIAHWTIARTHRAMGNLEEALKIQLQLEQDWAALGKKDGYVYEELGEIYLAQNKLEKSKSNFKKAYTELSTDPYLQKHEADRLKRIKQLSE